MVETRVIEHENNPTHEADVALELLKLRNEYDHTREYDVIERHTHHVVRLAGDLLDVARIAQSKIELLHRAPGQSPSMAPSCGEW